MATLSWHGGEYSQTPVKILISSQSLKMGRMLPFRLFRANIVGREQIGTTSDHPCEVCSAAALFWGAAVCRVGVFKALQICFSPSPRGGDHGIEAKLAGHDSTKRQLTFGCLAASKLGGYLSRRVKSVDGQDFGSAFFP